MDNSHFKWVVAASAVIATAAAIQIALCSRTWIGGDQAKLLNLALDYLEAGELTSVGRPPSEYGAGLTQGRVLQLAIALPIRVWPDYRAPIVLIGIFHLVAGIIVASTMFKAAGPKTAVLFLIVYWLSPWHLYHSGILWEPAYVFLPAALHLWACWRLREVPSMLPSVVLGVTLMIAFQFHPSALLLLILTVLIYLKRVIRPRAAGVVLGLCIAALALIPTVLYLSGRLYVALPPTEEIQRTLLVRANSVFRGLLYWFRMGSLHIGRRLDQVVYLDTDWAGESTSKALVRTSVEMFRAVTVASALLAVIASWWYFRRGNRGANLGAGRMWLRSYAKYGLIAILIGCGICPITIQGWHLIILSHAAAFPVTFWIADGLRTRRRWFRLILILFLALRIPEIAIIGLGHYDFRGKSLYREEAPRLPERLRSLLPDYMKEGLPDPESVESEK